LSSIEKKNPFLPATAEEMARLGWAWVDIVLVTGDAYVDHPSFGVALIARLLEAQGYRVAVLAQPRHHFPDDFTRFGKPRLFFGISAGNLDSIVSNYTGNAKVRDRDDYSPGGNPYFGEKAEKKHRRRPDRATVRYANLARAAFADVPVILGGLEASLRRFIHYDYQQQRLRASVLTDAKADLVVYGMGERAVLEIAERLSKGQDLHSIPGTCERFTQKQLAELDHNLFITLPGWDEIAGDNRLFLDAELEIDRQARALSDKVLIQKQQAAWVVQNHPAPILSAAEMDRLYSLPFTRACHPSCGDVPALKMIKDSFTIVRGCSGNCSFCAITRHQGPVVVSRSKASIVAEVKAVASSKNFNGTVTDLGGPTANLYGTSCKSPAPCRKHDCLYPKVCKFLDIDEQGFASLLREVAAVAGVKNVFVSSGLRMELLLKTPRLLEQLLDHHTPGALKIAPEHTQAKVLRLMHKPGLEVLQDFLALCRRLTGKKNKKTLLTPYLISAHPGCSSDDMEEMAERLQDLGLAVRQFQDFTPTPGTISTAMYVSGLDRETKTEIFVARNTVERRAQRLALERVKNKREKHKPVGKRKR